MPWYLMIALYFKVYQVLTHVFNIHKSVAHVKMSASFQMKKLRQERFSDKSNIMPRLRVSARSHNLVSIVSVVLFPQFYKQ